MAMSFVLGALVARSAAAIGRNRNSYVIGGALVLGAWFGLSTGIAAVGGFGAGILALPLLGLSLALPLTIGAAIGLTSSSIRRLISQPGIQPGVVAVHALRIVEGSVFVVMVPLGVLPAIFALPAGLGDVLIGMGALAASRWINSGQRGRVVWWNLFGLLDFANATVLGLMTTPGPLHLLHTNPTSALLLSSPLTIIPTFVVPMYALLHLVSLRFLAASRSEARLSRPIELEASS